MTDRQATNPQELLQQIRSFIAISREHVGSGGEADLSGLDDKVKELCDAVLDLPKPEADAFAPQMDRLIEELDALKAGMEKAQAEVREQLDSLNLRHKAALAYKTTGAAESGKKTTDDGE